MSRADWSKAPDWAKERTYSYESVKRSPVEIIDLVNHPAHYQSGAGIECIDAIHAALGDDGFVAHCRGTAMKYVFRAGKKGSAAEDLRKSAWYLDRAARVVENNEGEEK